MVLCPLSVTDGWVSEVAKFSPKLKVIKYVGEKEYRRSLRKMMYDHIKDHSIPDVSFALIIVESSLNFVLFLNKLTCSSLSLQFKYFIGCSLLQC